LIDLGHRAGGEMTLRKKGRVQEEGGNPFSSIGKEPRNKAIDKKKREQFRIFQKKGNVLRRYFSYSFERGKKKGVQLRRPISTAVERSALGEGAKKTALFRLPRKKEGGSEKKKRNIPSGGKRKPLGVGGGEIIFSKEKLRITVAREKRHFSRTNKGALARKT